jgi:Arf-GAP/coiled-coil/ANK repeat/PH domain-containing protein
VLIDQASKTVTRNLSKFLKEDMKQMKETKGYFNKISNDLDSALNKNAAASKSRPADIEDASNLLTATRSCFRYTGLDYAFQISMLQARKKHVVIESLAGFVSAHAAFFQQGHQLLSELEPYMKNLNTEIQAMQEAAGRLEKQLEKRHTYVVQEETVVLVPDSATASKGKATVGRAEGYLFKRGQNAFRTWNRRWFYLDSNKVNLILKTFV